MNKNKYRAALVPIPTNDMDDTQQSFFGVTTVNVQQQFDDTVNNVSTFSDTDAQVDSVGSTFVNQAPDLPFSLPFGLNKIFGIHPKK